MTIRHTTRCGDCKSDPDALTEIGEGVIIRGGREGDTYHALYQCSMCGSVWMKIEDRGGTEGRGQFWHRLTHGYF
ncbi:MAG: hypothetical protein QNJ82_07735 [Gammaproteobacteria bacterium]|nr:hypothetical protein [Gammaproteobacteria bacterium]